MPTYLEQKIAEYEHTPEFITQYAMLDLTAGIVAAMEEQGISRSELAIRAGLHPAQITRILRGDHNMTVRTLGKIAAALGLGLSLSITKKAGSTLPGKVRRTSAKPRPSRHPARHE